ncbi:hypothetical protein AALO_G00097370 [Alosa alosa]|uniref:ATF7-interacting protein protein binding domain-containing protein n=1 Tax=Alosa alosa TaxID=278164 RepID=A0AAV6GT22_9TELE|nr:hypothetical protein AALO_G00097370 [Alosa alosa]
MPHPQARSGRCPDGEKTEEKAGEATAEEERGGKRPRVEGLQLEVEAQIELKITDGAAGSRLKIEKVVQKLVEERLRVLELTVFDRTLQELKERVEKIDCATKHQGTLNTLQARIARLVKKFGAANQASENSRKVQEVSELVDAGAEFRLDVAKRIGCSYCWIMSNLNEIYNTKGFL